MFVPVSCTACGKPFQVPDAALGQLAPCPWCQAVVTALPVSVPQPAPGSAPEPVSPNAAPAAAEPLSLDDEGSPSPAPSARSPERPGPNTKARPVPAAKPDPPEDDEYTPPPAAPRVSRRPVLKTVAVWFVLVVVVTALTVAVLRRKEGHLVRAEWQAYTAPDGSCSADLLGRAVEDADAPGDGGRRYSSEGRYSGVRTWIGWRNLTQNEVQTAGAPEGWRLLRLGLFDPERERLLTTFRGDMVKDATIQFDPPITVEIRLTTPHGPLVERIIVKADGPRPRVYFVGITGKRLDPDGPEVDRLFQSFHVNE